MFLPEQGVIEGRNIGESFSFCQSEGLCIGIIPNLRRGRFYLTFLFYTSRVYFYSKHWKLQICCLNKHDHIRTDAITYIYSLLHFTLPVILTVAPWPWSLWTTSWGEEEGTTIVAGTPIFLATKAAAIPALPPRKRPYYWILRSPNCDCNVHIKMQCHRRNVTWGADNSFGLSGELQKRAMKWKRTSLCFSSRPNTNDTSDSQCLILWMWRKSLYKHQERVEGSYLLAEMSNATDLEGARGLRILHLQVDGGSHAFGHADALQQRCVQVEMLLHGAPDFNRMGHRVSDDLKVERDDDCWANAIHWWRRIESVFYVQKDGLDISRCSTWKILSILQNFTLVFLHFCLSAAFMCNWTE